MHYSLISFTMLNVCRGYENGGLNRQNTRYQKWVNRLTEIHVLDATARTVKAVLMRYRHIPRPDGTASSFCSCSQPANHPASRKRMRCRIIKNMQRARLNARAIFRRTCWQASIVVLTAPFCLSGRTTLNVK